MSGTYYVNLNILCMEGRSTQTMCYLEGYVTTHVVYSLRLFVAEAHIGIHWLIERRSISLLSSSHSFCAVDSCIFPSDCCRSSTIRGKRSSGYSTTYRRQSSCRTVSFRHYQTVSDSLTDLCKVRVYRSEICVCHGELTVIFYIYICIYNVNGQRYSSDSTQPKAFCY